MCYGYERLDINERIGDWVDETLEPSPIDQEPENVPLPPQDEHELELLKEDKGVKPENIPLPPQNEDELQEIYGKGRGKDN